MPPVNINKLSFDAQQALGRQYLDAHGLHGWSFSVENLRNIMYAQQHGGYLGFCDHREKVIRVDWRIGRQFRQTMLHEIAHALLPPEVGHGMGWIELAGKIGVTLNHRFPYMLALALVKPWSSSQTRCAASVAVPSRCSSSLTRSGEAWDSMDGSV